MFPSLEAQLKLLKIHSSATSRAQLSLRQPWARQQYARTAVAARQARESCTSRCKRHTATFPSVTEARYCTSRPGLDFSPFPFVPFSSSFFLFLFKEGLHGILFCGSYCSVYTDIHFFFSLLSTYRHHHHHQGLKWRIWTLRLRATLAYASNFFVWALFSRRRIQNAYYLYYKLLTVNACRMHKTSLYGVKSRARIKCSTTFPVYLFMFFFYMFSPLWAAASITLDQTVTASIKSRVRQEAGLMRVASPAWVMVFWES